MTPRSSRIANLICLILAGEVIFSLPFHITRYFRPTFLETFDLSNAALGDIFAGYGIVAMLAYFPGGLLADRFSARRLIVLSLVATAFGGFYLARIPNGFGLRILFAYWGLTTILLFWAALLRATKDWGGADQQGIAFGLLDGGRGLVAALGASTAVLLFSRFAGQGLEALSASQRIAGIQSVIYFYVALALLVALLCWIFLPEREAGEVKAHTKTRSLGSLFSNPLLWLQATIVLTAYCAYKGLDNYGVYLVEVMNVTEVRAAELMALSAYLRPVGAIAAGLLADRFRASKVIVVVFCLLAVIYMVAALSSPTAVRYEILMLNLWISFIAVFALRGIYFALTSEAQVLKTQTGAAIGLVSVVGFTPDVFFYSVAGRLLDRNPGLVGHQHYFYLLAGIAACGVLASVLLARAVPPRQQAV
ncbi:MAG: MFS transporter [Gammaproteobacteria bacterium]